MGKKKDLKPQRIRVTIDAEIRQLIPKYLNNRRNDIRAILRAVENGDFETVRALGHSMKGSGATYGFQSISDIGFSLENAAFARRKTKVKKSINDLSRYLDRLEIVFQ